MTKALFLPLLAMASLLNFSGTFFTAKVVKQTKQAPEARPFCGPWLTFYNNTSYTITRIKLQNTSLGTVELTNPTFPFTYQPGYGGLYHIWVTTSQDGDAGTVQAYNTGDPTLINCRTFISPQVWSLNFTTSCSQYDILITADASCP